MTQPQTEADDHVPGAVRAADAAVAAEAAGVDSGTQAPLDGLKVVDRETGKILSAVARAMYPHDQLPDLHYERIAAALDTKAAADETVAATLREGIALLATCTGRRPEEFAELDEAEQVATLRRMEETAFFTAVASETVVNLYSQHDAWPYFGYEGMTEKGYLDTFDDIDWVDDAPDRRSNAVAASEQTDKGGTVETVVTIATATDAEEA